MNGGRDVIATCAGALLVLTGCGGEPGNGGGEQTGTAGPLIELRLVSETAASGLERSEWEGADLWLEPEPVISNPDFASLSAYTRPGSLRLRIDLSDEAGERFGEVTGGNIGRRLAMLIDGRVVSAPVIRDRLGPRAIADIPLDASVPLLQEEAERLAAAINEADSGSQFPPGRR